MPDELIKFIPDEELTANFVLSALSETQDWGLIAQCVPKAHLHTKGAGIKIAILDTGYSNHNDLEQNVIQSFDYSNTSNVSDSIGHGTHIAGIIAAAENGIGIIGVAPEAKLYPIKVLDDGGHGGFDAIEMGIRHAISLNVDIISMSLGASVLPPNTLHQAIQEAAAKGIIIVAAAGNDSGAVNWPARYDEVIAVAAMDQNGNLARFSSRGDQIAFGAPGVNVYSTYLNNGYAILNGTSQAAPFIAGVCALILAYTRIHPELPQINNYKDMLQALSNVCNTAGQVGKRGDFGYGVPNFANINWN